jgi:hypothetical protein
MQRPLDGQRAVTCSWISGHGNWNDDMAVTSVIVTDSIEVIQYIIVMIGYDWVTRK